MSKFFKALEHAEREREQLEASHAAPSPGAATSPAPDAPGPITPAGTGAPPAGAGAAAPDHAGAGETAAPPATAVEAPAVPDAPAEGRRPAYGAPLAPEEGRSAPRRAWHGLLEPAPGEPGELDDHLVSLLEPTSLAAEQYRAIRLHVENARRERGLGLVAVSSPGRGDGKTVSAINLAGALAQAPDARVALVDVDVRHPGAARALGLPAGRGLSTYLLDRAVPVEAVLARPAGVGFAVVVAGPASAMPYELLKSPRLAALFEELRQRFDFVVVDTPPVLPFPDVGILRDLVDGFVLVVRANRTPRELVRDSLTVVGTHRVLGVIFNDDERTAAALSPVERAGWRSVLSRPLGTARAA